MLKRPNTVTVKNVRAGNNALLHPRLAAVNSVRIIFPQTPRYKKRCNDKSRFKTIVLKSVSC